MKYSIVISIALFAVTACVQARPPDAPALSALSGEWREPDSGAQSLDGRTVEGHVRARGPMGLVSVPGTLCFAEGQLVWTARDTADSGPYRVREANGAIEFHAEHLIENGERTVWTGRFDGTAFHDVSAAWHRVEGDFVHDLLLPDVVVLDFTPVD